MTKSIAQFVVLCEPRPRQLQKQQRNLRSELAREVRIVYVDTGTILIILECREYSQFNFVNSTVQSAVLGEKAVDTQKDDCGHKSVELIVGGTEAGDREFPHMASIHQILQSSDSDRPSLPF